jgi:acetyl-CoA carboxylase carboxyltransferase component
VDLDELLARRALTEDAARPEAVARRHAAGGRTARENLADLVDPESFVEYGRFAIAAQRGRRELEDLIARTPADGFIGGTATVNAELFGDEAGCAVLSYDYTVLAGTQGALGHLKKDRLFELIERMRLPTVLFAEGGGGRPGDTDYPVVSALDTRAFALWARLSGLVPRIAIVAGRCFAGNAVLAGECSVDPPIAGLSEHSAAAVTRARCGTPSRRGPRRGRGRRGRRGRCRSGACRWSG